MDSAARLRLVKAGYRIRVDDQDSPPLNYRVLDPHNVPCGPWRVTDAMAWQDAIDYSEGQV